VAKLKTPAPRRAGTSKTKLARAERLARKALRDLGHDLRALKLVLQVVRELAKRSRRPRR
jgi:hypothetical protein